MKRKFPNIGRQISIQGLNKNKIIDYLSLETTTIKRINDSCQENHLRIITLYVYDTCVKKEQNPEFTEDQVNDFAKVCASKIESFEYSEPYGYFSGENC
jgi:hypothetical protein